jgi:hypothetical protein
MKMSAIDTGLGWGCDSDYYVDTAGTMIRTSESMYPDNFYKSYDGASVAAIC